MEFSKNKTLIPVRIPAEPDPDFIYLGIWAVPEKKVPDPADLAILPYHYRDRNLLRADYDLCLSLYQHWVSKLGTLLNRIHGVSYPLRSWKILLGPWLLGFINVLCDRHRSLQAALQEKRIGKVITLSEDSFQIPLDYLEYVYLLEEDKYNHQIYTQLLSLMNMPVGSFEPLARKENQLDPSATTNRKEVFKNTLKRMGNEMISLIPGSKYSQIAIRLMGAQNTLALFYRSRGKLRPLLAPFLFPSEIDSDPAQRKDLGQSLESSDTKKDSHFLDRALETLISHHLPRLYLEGFSSLRNTQTQKSENLILGGGEVHQDEACKAWVAESISRNPETKIMVGQHGGFYGTAAFSPLEFHERDIADYYLTMGWQEERTIPYSNPLLFSAMKGSGQNPIPGSILFASNTGPRYLRRIWSSPVAASLLEYYRSREKFLRAVGEEYRDQILVRLHPRDHGWGQKTLLNDLPWVKQSNFCLNLR